MKLRKKKRKNTFILLLMLVVGLGVGYALISSSLAINGVGRFNSQTWNIYFEDLTYNPGNVTLSQNDSPASINPTTKTDITFTVTLQEPGDFYEFEVSAVNAGTMDAMVGLVINNLNGNPISSTNQLPAYASYTATYSDGVEIEPNHLLEAGYSENYKVRVEYRTDIDPEDLPDEVEELTFNFGVQYIQADTNTVVNVPHPESLYGVMEAYAQEGTYAMKYTGAHQDSYAGTGNKDIYHWYATTNARGTEILDRNNVIFAGQCWQMIRTTDTGGVKLLYNGEVENNQCLNTRGTHVGYGDTWAEDLYGYYYYYGTDYTYDPINKVFALAGTITQETWNETTGPTLIGKYTCKSTNAEGTCSTLYLIESQNDRWRANILYINKNSYYSQLGTLEYNAKENSLAYVGYMYNDVYPVESVSSYFRIAEYYSTTINTNYYYSSTIDWNNTNANQYTLLNPQLISTLNGDYSSLVGKYILGTSGTNYNYAYYILAVSGTTAYYRKLENGDTNTSLTVGDSYTESGGVYTLTGNVTNVTYLDWYNNTSDYSIYKGKYMCEGNNTTCTSVKHLTPYSNPEKKTLYYYDSNKNYSYSEGVSYNGTTYTLTGDIKTLWDVSDSTNQSILATHHYTCFENGMSCTTVGYISFINTIRDTVYYVRLSGVENMEKAIEKMLYASNVNTKNSLIKAAIDAWYAKYLSPYDSYIEDTIFCNDRTLKTKGGWDSNGGLITNRLYFQESTASKDLSCDRATDQFSTLNPAARLTYKVGLPSIPEMNLFNNNKARSVGNSTFHSYWLATPNSYGVGVSSSRVYYSGYIENSLTTSVQGIRPSISLIPGITYTKGDGSMASPFVIE